MAPLITFDCKSQDRSAEADLGDPLKRYRGRKAETTILTTENPSLAETLEEVRDTVARRRRLKYCLLLPFGKYEGTAKILTEKVSIVITAEGAT